MQSHLKAAIRHYHPEFAPDALQAGLALFERKTFRAKDLILKAGEPCQWLFWADSSITRCYYVDEEGREQTLWMKPEQTFITEFKSFVSQQPSGFFLQFYEDTEAWCISRQDLLHLYAMHNDWARFGAHLTEQVHVTLIDVFVNLLANDATRNYQYIEYAFPRFLQVAPLKDIASMLQVSQVTLSRIRAGTQTKGGLSDR